MYSNINVVLIWISYSYRGVSFTKIYASKIDLYTQQSIPGISSCQKREVGQVIANETFTITLIIRTFSTTDIWLIFGQKHEIQVERQTRTKEEAERKKGKKKDADE